LEPECVIELDPEAGLSRFEAVELVFLPGMIQHDEELVARLQDPAQPALETDILALCGILHMWIGCSRAAVREPHLQVPIVLVRFLRSVSLRLRATLFKPATEIPESTKVQNIGLPCHL